MIIEWIIIIGIIVALYVVIYKYEKKMDNLQKLILENQKKISNNNDIINENKEKIVKNREYINKNHNQLKEHHSYIERMWVTIPKIKEKKSSK